MNINEDMKKQLMAMAGMTDPAEFESFLKNIEPATREVIAASSNGKSGRESPFSLHFIKMMDALEKHDLAGFEACADLRAQIAHAHSVIDAVDEYRDVHNMLRTKTRTEKSDREREDTSKAFRDRGNKFYAKKEFAKAVDSYTLSILEGPLDLDLGFGRDVALGLGNRSAVFFELKEYEKCLDDISAAILFGYPGDLKYKVLDRRARCFSALGYVEDAAKAFQECLGSLKVSNLKPDKAKTFDKAVNDALNDLKSKPGGGGKGSYIEPESREVACPFKIWEPHPSFPHVTDGLDIVHGEGVGRYIVATRDIQAGEAIVIEEPIASHLSPYKMRTNCSHCFRICGTSALPSPRLRKARFCCLRCLRQAMVSWDELLIW